MMMFSKRTSVLMALPICLGVCGCATTGIDKAIPAHDNRDAVLWLQTSAEYAAVTSGIFAAAGRELERVGGSDLDRNLHKAVVMDIDETVLDNSAYQAQLVIEDETYNSESWDQWVALKAAEAVPGAVHFIQLSQRLGLHIAFITNRTCRPRADSADRPCPQKAETLANLEAVGVDTRMTSLAMRGEVPPARCQPLLSAAEQATGKWSSDKTSRRNCIAAQYETIMLLGDQLGDFFEERADSDTGAGRSLAKKYLGDWGKTWFLLPNPTYGNWRPQTRTEKQSIIRGID